MRTVVPNDDRPNGAQGDSPGQAERRPGTCGANHPVHPVGVEPMRPSTDVSMVRRADWIGNRAHVSPLQGFAMLLRVHTQGGAALYPGLSHYAPLGRRGGNAENAGGRQ